MLAMCLIYIPYSMVLLCFWLLFWLHYSTFSSFSQIFPLSLISASSLMVLLPPSVHLSICFLLLIEVWVPLQSQLLQLFWMDTNPFPIQLGDLIPPVGGASDFNHCSIHKATKPYGSSCRWWAPTRTYVANSG